MGEGVSDEQLDEWGGLASMMSVSAVYEIAVTGSGAIQALIGEVRASHAREDQARAAAVLANKVGLTAAAERDVLQQRIDKALDVCDKFDPPGRLPAITFDGTPFPSAARSVRAALTGTDNQSTEETR